MFRNWAFRALLLASASFFLGFTASAQTASFVNEDQGFETHFFRPAIDSKGYISTNGTNILGAGDYSFGLVLDVGLSIMPYHAFGYEQDTEVFDDDGDGVLDRG